MKLRNKKTGEIIILIDHIFDNYKTLAELNEEWEDYEEPKELYWVNYDGSISHAEEGTMSFGKQKQIGNYFDTREEAEKAVEKLKAWKRLKDKGFVWQGWEEGSMDNGMCVIGCQIPENNWETDVVEDLDLLFGGEE